MLSSPLKRFFSRRQTAARVLCVLGMHRSGTSCLTGTLESWGVFLGDVWRKNAHNTKGSRESRSIMALHDAVLTANGGSWFEPPAEVHWDRAQRSQLRALIDGFSGHACWGFKDPRTLLALDGWLEELPSLEFIGIFRHPMAVAASLHKRDPELFPDLERGLKLWAAYNERLLAFHARRRFPVLCFDARAEDFSRQLDKVREQLGFPAPAAAESFFDDGLRHQHAEEASVLPAEVSDVWGRLQAL